ncbi:MAG: hypothetical protein ABI950_13525 [Solirubrobacteraceae bacterium]
MASHPGPASSGPPFPLEGSPDSPWREQALTRIGEQRFVLAWVTQLPGAIPLPPEALSTIRDHWEAATATAKDHRRRGASIERVTGHLDAVDTDLLRLAPDSYVYGQLPGLLEHVRKLLPRTDMRRRSIERLAAQKAATPLSSYDRDLVVAASHAASSQSRREVNQLRSFKRVLQLTAALMMLGAIGLGVFTAIWPEKLPMCFSPSNTIVCTTSTRAIVGAPEQTPNGQPSTVSPARVDAAMRNTADGWDVAVVEGVGLLAAALAAAASMRTISGSSKPYGLPIALALLKLPTGAVTAVFGLLLMRGGFVPGLSDLDSSGQIIAWAVVLGYSQQLLTRFVDQRAQTVLDNFGRSHEDRESLAKSEGAVPAAGSAATT